MTGVRIRPAAEADAALLAELGARTFRETFAGICSPEDLQAFLTSTYHPEQQRLEVADPARPARVLEVGGVPAGFLQVRLNHREPGVPGDRPTELQRIYVLRAFQGAGHGAALMAEAERIARAARADVLWLGVWENNHRALAFYAKAGFREVGEHIFKIGAQVDRDLLLAKGLA